VHQHALGARGAFRRAVATGLVRFPERGDREFGGDEAGARLQEEAHAHALGFRERGKALEVDLPRVGRVESARHRPLEARHVGQVGKPGGVRIGARKSAKAAPKPWRSPLREA
jgi:hypothetical protein